MKTDFVLSLPRFPYCTDDPTEGTYRKPKPQALKHALIQPNAENLIRWLPFDIDAEDAYFRPEERGLPEPSFYMFNRENGHAHVLYELETPVSVSCNSHTAPMQFLADVQRGVCNRLGADVNYHGNLCKNLVHPRWQVHGTGASPISLHRLNDFLSPEDKLVRRDEPIGVGRNCSLFDRLRAVAYTQVFQFKQNHKDENDFRRFLETVAVQINYSFPSPLFLTEVGSVSKSVAKWTWRRFDPTRTSARFSAIQRERVLKRWRAYTPRIREAKKTSIS